MNSPLVTSTSFIFHVDHDLYAKNADDRDGVGGGMKLASSIFVPMSDSVEGPVISPNPLTVSPGTCMFIRIL